MIFYFKLRCILGIIRLEAMPHFAKVIGAVIILKSFDIRKPMRATRRLR